jgi:hypothetical protein
MSCRWIGLVLCAAAVMAAENPRPPVLVELFTSEGCSSCPPADALLEQLDRRQIVPEAHVIALSEHVDYWNHLGWTDPWSSRLFSNRQEFYARLFGTSGPYTPQMVVDGAAEFVGSDARAAVAAIRAAAGKPKLPMRLTGAGPLRLEIDSAAARGNRKAVVYVAFAEDAGTSNVLHGENRGRTLRHVAIARELRRLGVFAGTAGYAADIPLPISANGAARRVIAFVQDPDSGRVLGAVEAPLAATRGLVP